MKKSSKSITTRRKLILIRHSNAEDLHPGIPDFERSLTIKGKVNSRLMARVLGTNGEHPGRIVSSPAFRALETALIFAGEHGISPADIRLSPVLYTGIAGDDFKSYINDFDDDDNTVTLFGHNPMISEMAAYFAGDDPDPLPKTAICAIGFDAENWSGIVPGSGTTLYFLTPKEIS